MQDPTLLLLERVSVITTHKYSGVASGVKWQHELRSSSVAQGVETPQCYTPLKEARRCAAACGAAAAGLRSVPQAWRCALHRTPDASPYSRPP